MNQPIESVYNPDKSRPCPDTDSPKSLRSDALDSGKASASAWLQR